VSYDLIVAAALWVFVAVVAIANRGQIERPVVTSRQEAGIWQKERHGSR
jgi:hypothetical protein